MSRVRLILHLSMSGKLFPDEQIQGTASELCSRAVNRINAGFCEFIEKTRSFFVGENLT